MRYGFAVVLVSPAPPHLYKCGGAGGKVIEGEIHAERMSMFWYNSGLKRQDDCMQTRRQDEVRRRCARRLCASGCVAAPSDSESPDPHPKLCHIIYFKHGEVLYKNFFNEQKHKDLKERIVNDITIPWIVSYDDVPEIREIYNGVPSKSFSLNYSLANNGKGREIMFFSKSLVPTAQELQSIGMESMFGAEDQQRQ